VDAPVTYALQFDVPADTIGTSAWANATTIAVGEDVLSKSLQGIDLNEIALDFGLPQDVEGHLVVRAVATLDRAVYSEAIVLTVTPFVQVITQTVLYVPGQYQNWDPATAAQLHAIDAGVFQGFVTFPEGALEFKFTNLPNWDEFYGPNGTGGITFMADGNLFAPAAGSYQVTVNLNTLSYTLTPYSFGIIGTATPGGWDADTDMAWDHQNEQWTWTGNLVAGALKFRLNDAWATNYGTDTNGTVMYFDNQGAHNVTEAGNYTVTFAVDANPATATYSVTLN
ncbi:MAG: SusF/SusE family outer membrane protein, partial [Sphingobacteriales bacterium]